jgi:ribosomal protein S18 acetylase RimI-like enzyme
MQIRALIPDDATQYQALRLRGLREAPAAFASSFEEESATSADDVARRLQPKDSGAIFGCFDQSALAGVVGVQRETMLKLRHKAFIWGMYVAPEYRRRGHAKPLLAHALQHAWQSLQVVQVNLGVHTLNTAALALYRNAGFEIWGTERGSLIVGAQPQDEHHMVCRAPQ